MGTKISAMTTLATSLTGNELLELSSPSGSPTVYATRKIVASKLNTQAIQLACSDESTVITAGTAKITFRMPFAMTLTAVRASLSVASSATSPETKFTVDINESGVSILSTKLTFDATEKTTTTAAVPAVISDSALADDAEITIDVDHAGSATAKGLKVTLIGIPLT